MRLRVVDQGQDSPIASHAVPYGIARAMAADAAPVVTLCMPRSRYLSVGASQDLAEVDLDHCRSSGIAVLRRAVGGGAVLLDRDQLYIHIVLPRRMAPAGSDRLFSRFLAPIVATYADLGIETRRRPPGDIEAAGRKLGASAAAEIGEAVVVATSFLFDFDRAAMARCLRVRDEAFRDRLRESLVDHLVTIRELLPARPSRARVKALFLAHLAAALGADPEEDRPSSAEAASIAAEAARQTDPAWVHRPGRRDAGAGIKIAEGVRVPP